MWGNLLHVGIEKIFAKSRKMCRAQIMYIVYYAHRNKWQGYIDRTQSHRLFSEEKTTQFF